jgi:hypothetical protein
MLSPPVLVTNVKALPDVRDVSHYVIPVDLRNQKYLPSFLLLAATLQERRPQDASDAYPEPSNRRRDEEEYVGFHVAVVRLFFPFASIRAILLRPDRQRLSQGRGQLWQPELFVARQSEQGQHR